MSWFIAALRKYGTFQGRAQRAEYWYYTLFYILFYVAAKVLDHVLGTEGHHKGPGLLTLLFIVAMLVPGFAVGARRMHDINRTGWWVLISFVPIVGAFIFLYFAVQDSDPHENRFGPNPKARHADQNA